MADENSTTGPVDGSSAPKLPAGLTPPQQPTPEPEVRIIEETIVKPAPSAKPSGPAASPPTPPVPPISPISPPAPPIKETVSPPSTVEKVPTEKAPVQPAPTPAAPATPITPPVPPATPAQTVSPPPIPSPSISSTPTSAPEHTPEKTVKEQETISRILKEVKLPERRLAPEEDQPHKDAKVFDTTLGASPPAPAPATTPVGGPPPTPPEQVVPDEKPEVQQQTPGGRGLISSIVTPLRTLKDDLQEVIRVQRVSLVHAVALEQEKHHGQTRLEQEKKSTSGSRWVLGMLLFAALLILLGAAAFFGVFFIMSERSAAPSEGPQSSILFAENTVPFPLDNSTAIDLKRMLSQARQSGAGTLGSITRIVPVDTTTAEDGQEVVSETDLADFLGRIGAQPPEDLLRALSPEFFFGFHTVDENAPLFIIPVLSYERAFAGMLAWESNMNSGLAPVFTSVPDQITGVSGLPEKRRFDDIVMRNYDVRALKDDAGTIELYYSFPTRALLVIAESAYSFTEILNRLRAERKL